ncbi:Ig-like domain-containing protein [Oceanirhabdus seepicola]|uniref:Ig-like domain-containing protein n=1 Tax=Oceanirhabdus seepicola TaxID=2828781 RepID=A0A9J6P4J5_9CLOT|nr:Ig-like domain-containing protein [Oceanirhabdus seepicola]MCM1991639.1 Ig-like domain-containing protein [Oceanirhabdus seepicola]
MKKIIRILLLTMFIMNIMIVNTLAEENHEKAVVKSDKIWTIVFNKAVPEGVLENIIVKDSKDKIINVSLEIKEEKKILIYPPEGGYSPLEEYTLVVKRTENGLKEDYEFKFKISYRIKNVIQLWDFTYYNNEYEAPRVVEAILENGEKVNVPVRWDEEILTNEMGTFTYVGNVRGYNEKVTLKLIVFPKVVSVKDINVSLYVGDEYSLPKKLKVKYSDGTTGMEKINWTTNQLDIKKVGEYVCEGEIDGCDNVIKANITVKSNFLLSQTVPNQNQQDYKMKYNYMDLVFAKDTVRCYEVGKIILKDENGVRIKIKKTQPGITAKDNFLIIPSRPLDSNTKYTLFVPKGLIKAADGDVYQKDIEINFKTK